MKRQALSDGARMLAQFNSIWDFALAFYAQDGVQNDCLTAQDRFGLDINALIYALYRTQRGTGFDARDVVSLSETMTKTIVGPIRAARIALKTPPASVDASATHALREKVKAAELDGERLTLEALTQLADGPPAPSLEAALASVAAATDIAVDTDLDMLLKRLALSAQNM
jgi:uncharacterized protein (TIGR02444 family)